MSDSIFEIRAEGVDVQQIVRGIREDVERKIRDGVYADARIARAEQHQPRQPPQRGPVSRLLPPVPARRRVRRHLRLRDPRAAPRLRAAARRV